MEINLLVASSQKSMGKVQTISGPTVVAEQVIAMDTRIEDTFDGQVFRPLRPISFPPNTNV